MFKRMYSYEYKGFTIRLAYGDWIVFGTSKDTMKYGYIGKFDSDIEAENYINREFFLC